MIVDKYGYPVAKKYERRVMGMTREYVEFSEEDRLAEFYIPSNKRWRLHTSKSISFINYTPHRNSDVVIYKQIRPAGYADFTIGKYHIAVEDIQIKS